MNYNIKFSDWTGYWYNSVINGMVENQRVVDWTSASLVQTEKVSDLGD